jgi:hypothetical protein
MYIIINYHFEINKHTFETCGPVVCHHCRFCIVSLASSILQQELPAGILGKKKEYFKYKINEQQEQQHYRPA